MAAPHNKGHARGNRPTAFFGVEGVIIASLRTSTCCLVSDCKFEFARFIYAKDKTWVNVFPLCMCRLDGHNPQADGRCRKGRHCKNTKKDLNHWWKRKKICCDAPVKCSENEFDTTRQLMLAVWITKLSCLLKFQKIERSEHKSTLWLIHSLRSNNSQRHKLTNSKAYQLTSSPTQMLVNSNAQQLPKTQTHQPTNSQAQNFINSNAYQLKSSTIQKLNNSRRHQLTNPSTNQPTHKPINSKAHQLINSEVHQLTNSQAHQLTNSKP